MRLNKLVTVCVLLTPVAVMTGGCVDNKTTLYIDRVAGFDPDGNCEVALSLQASGEVAIGQGYYDPQVPYAYVAPLIIGNQLVPLGDNNTLRPETSRIQLAGAEVRVEPPPGASSIPAFTTYFAGTVNPEDSTDPGLALVTVPVIPGDAQLDDGIYRFSIKVFGETLGGTEVESGEFIFPIQIQNGGSTDNCATIDEVDPHPCGYVQDGYLWPCDSLPINGVSTCPSGCN
jgi:hypothetical protein